MKKGERRFSAGKDPRRELEVNGRKKAELDTTRIENFIQIERANKRPSYSTLADKIFPSTAKNTFCENRRSPFSEN